MRLITDILETLYPTCCPGCGRVVDPNVQWCEACLRKIWNPRLLNSSFTDHLSGCYTCCDYAGAIRDCIIQIKYGGRLCAAPFPLSLVGQDGGVRIGDPYPAVFGEEEMARV